MRVTKPQWVNHTRWFLKGRYWGTRILLDIITRPYSHSRDIAHYCRYRTIIRSICWCHGQCNCSLFSLKKNTERHTAHTIVSWPNPKQWVIVHTSDLMMIIRQSIYIISIITREMGKLKTHSPTYCIMDNWENMPYLNHTLDKIYLTGLL